MNCSISASERNFFHYSATRTNPRRAVILQKSILACYQHTMQDPLWTRLNVSLLCQLGIGPFHEARQERSSEALVGTPRGGASSLSDFNWPSRPADAQAHLCHFPLTRCYYGSHTSWPSQLAHKDTQCPLVRQSLPGLSRGEPF